jgi:hypothetical protein
MERYSVDESGYTGADLMSEEQRFQGASAIAIPEDDAKRLIREHFPKLQAPELKYSSIARRKNYAEPTMRLLKDALEHYKSVTYVIDKRFLLSALFLDYAAEPYYHERDFNFYEDGLNYMTASLIYRTGPTFLGEDLYNGIILAFQQAMKDKTPEAVQDLIKKVRNSKAVDQFPFAFAPIAEPDPDCIRAIANKETNTDAAMVLLLGLVNRMEVMSPEPYRIEHDRSKNLTRYGDILQSFIANDEEVDLKMTKIASLKFPLKLEEVVQVNSEDSASVQIADVLVGAAVGAGNALAGHRESETDPMQVLGLYEGERIIHLVPSTDWEEQKEFRQGSQGGEAIEYIADMVHKFRKKS